MKITVTILKKLCVPIMAFSFVVIGGLAIISSAYIEYVVLKEWITVGQEPNSFAMAPLAIVFVLEGLKVYLHFYGSALKRSANNTDLQNTENKEIIRLISIVRSMLFFFSMLCSIIFINNQFFMDTISAPQETVLQNENWCDSMLENGKKEINAKIENDIAEALKPYQSRIKNYEELIRTAPSPASFSTASKRKDAKEYIDSLELSLNQSINELTETRKKAYKDISLKYEEELLLLERMYGNNGEKRLSGTSLEVQSTADNPYLKVFLLSICQTFKHTNCYTRSTYWLFVIGIALVISIVLEYAIKISQLFLSLPNDFFMNLSGPPILLSESEKRQFKKITYVMLALLISSGTFLFICLSFGTDVSKMLFIIVLLSYLITIGCSIILELDENKPEIEEKSENTFFILLRKELPGIIFPGIISFAVYSILGFISGGSFQFNSISSIAVAMGGSVSKLFLNRTN